jgi:hypothetical protein
MESKMDGWYLDYDMGALAYLENFRGAVESGFRDVIVRHVMGRYNQG